MTNQILVEASPARMLIDDYPHEAFTEAAVGFVLIDGTLHLTLTAFRFGYRAKPEPVNRVVIGRTVLPFPCAHGLAAGSRHFKLHARDDGSTPE